MRRPWRSRTTSLLTALWFVVMSVAPEMTHACPRHGSHGTTASPASTHDDHGAAHSSAPDHSAPLSNDQCTCLGPCCCAPPVALVVTTLSLAAAPNGATRDAGLPDYAYIPVALQHVLPFANAPPLSA